MPSTCIYWVIQVQLFPILVWPRWTFAFFSLYENSHFCSLAANYLHKSGLKAPFSPILQPKPSQISTRNPARHQSLFKIYPNVCKHRLLSLYWNTIQPKDTFLCLCASAQSSSAKRGKNQTCNQRKHPKLLEKSHEQHTEVPYEPFTTCYLYKSIFSVLLFTVQRPPEVFGHWGHTKIQKFFFQNPIFAFFSSF